jgi:hypothetical protein
MVAQIGESHWPTPMLVSERELLRQLFFSAQRDRSNIYLKCKKKKGNRIAESIYFHTVLCCGNSIICTSTRVSVEFARQSPHISRWARSVLGSAGGIPKASGPPLFHKDASSQS